MEIIKIKVKVNMPKTKITGKNGDIYKVDVKAKPEKNEANKEIIKFFSRKFKRRVRIMKGLKNRIKLLAFEA